MSHQSTNTVPCIFTQQQLMLFSIAATPGNTLIDYDICPKFLHQRHGKKVSLDHLGANGFVTIPVPDGRVYELIPAQLQKKNNAGGVEMQVVYPGTREALIEECLIDFAKNGEFTAKKGIPGYRLEGSTIKILFTLHQLKMALQALGKSYKSEELREGLDVLALAKFRLKTTTHEREKVMSYIVQELDSIVNRHPSDAIRSDRIYCVTLDQRASQKIIEGHYRTYDARLSLRMHSPVARFIYKQMTQHWLNATVKNGTGSFYTIRQNETLLMSGCALSENVTKRKDVIVDALNELYQLGVLQQQDFHDQVAHKTGRRIVDIEFVIRPTPSFVDQQIQGHSRYREAQKVGSRFAAKQLRQS